MSYMVHAGHVVTQTLSEVRSLMLSQVSNSAYKHTAVDVSERNILALLHELYTGRVAEASDLRGGCVHRARPARGPTTAEVGFLAAA